MQRFFMASLILLFHSSWDGFASTSEVRFIKRNFNYQLLTSNPLRFEQQYGRIPEGKGHLATHLESFLNDSRANIKAAIYGVHKQNWFFDTLKFVKERIDDGVLAVVDQRSGDYGQWQPENFTYPDTHRLPKLLGESQVLPDLGSNNQVRASTIMHNKFFVSDNKSLWIGSANISNTGIGSGYNANSVLILQEPNLAMHFAREFDQMFGARHFSRKKPPHENNHFRYMDGTTASVYFSPQDPVIQEGILPQINQAEQQIDIAMFYLTEASIIEALVKAADRGVQIRIIIDALASRHQSSPLPTLRASNIDVRVENWGGKMHMKSAIIDEKTVITGSMNWSKAGANRNDEATLVVKNEALALELKQYFETLWSSLDFYENQPNPTKVDQRAESLNSSNSCFDGIDNDYDGKTDAQDSACQSRFKFYYLGLKFLP